MTKFHIFIPYLKEVLAQLMFVAVVSGVLIVAILINSTGILYHETHSDRYVNPASIDLNDLRTRSIRR